MDRGVAREIEGLNELAPLHTPENLKGYPGGRRGAPEGSARGPFRHAFPSDFAAQGLRFMACRMRCGAGHRCGGTASTALPTATWAWRYAHSRYARDDYKLNAPAHMGHRSMCAVNPGKSP